MEGTDRLLGSPLTTPAPSLSGELVPTLGLAPVPFRPTPSLWAGGPRGPIPEVEIMRWCGLYKAPLFPSPQVGQGRGRRQVHGPGIVGAAAPLRPGSGALRTPARSTLPSQWSEGGDGGSNSWAGSWIAASGGRSDLGARPWRLGVARGFTNPSDTGLRSRPRLGRNQPRASLGHARGPSLGVFARPRRPSSEAAAPPGGQTWNRSRATRPPLGGQSPRHAPQTSRLLHQIRDRLCAPPSAQSGAQPLPTPSSNCVGGSLGCCSSARGGAPGS